VRHNQDMTRRKLIRLTDIAELLGVSKQRAHQLAAEKGFPRPRHLPNGTRVWRADVGRPMGRAPLVGNEAVADELRDVFSALCQEWFR
jgi:predicted DNA-binding transcriptional regulator AlpA